MKFYQMLHWLLLRPYSTENSRAERLEIGAARGIQGPTHLSSQTELLSAPSRKELTLFTQTGPSRETDS